MSNFLRFIHAPQSSSDGYLYFFLLQHTLETDLEHHHVSNQHALLCVGFFVFILGAVSAWTFVVVVKFN